MNATAKVTNFRKNNNQECRASDFLDSNLSERVSAYAVGLLITTAIIQIFGLVMLYSVSYQTDGTFFIHAQIRWLIISLMVGAVVFTIGYRMLADFSPVILFVLAAMLLAAVLFYPPTNGAYRWLKIELGGLKISIQPSEFVKVGLVLYVGNYCANHFRTVASMFGRYGAWRPLFVVALMCGLVVMGHDLGTTLLLVAIAGVILFTAGLCARYYLFAFGMTFLLGMYLYLFDKMRWGRVISFLDPEKYKEDISYQLWYSILALGSGSWTGMGFLKSRIKASYLPEKHTDFIISIVGEELGFTALFVVVVLYLVFTYFALKISCSCQRKQGMFIGLGLTTTIVIQALINIGVVSGALPTKGIPAPFLSYGGSSLLMSSISVAIILSIAVDTINPDFNQKLWNKIRKRKKSTPN